MMVVSLRMLLCVGNIGLESHRISVTQPQQCRRHRHRARHCARRTARHRAWRCAWRRAWHYARRQVRRCARCYALHRNRALKLVYISASIAPRTEGLTDKQQQLRQRRASFVCATQPLAAYLILPLQCFQVSSPEFLTCSWSSLLLVGMEINNRMRLGR